ncbi:hypothetical protein PHMEG_0009965 [Phytophthora megakarya]|uniref:Uncharacterized protein n=1 Tax=Phytophthora megakarya TaxID=4795 RepID=A0A225WEV5_9STRA|nr:hypothetical protein PHMEG_0009965 [Phytophthora megakarya]
MNKLLVRIQSAQKKKGMRPLSAVWYEWFTAAPRVFALRSVKPTLYQSRHAVGYMLLFVPMGFALHEASAAFKSEVQGVGERAQENLIAFFHFCAWAPEPSLVQDHLWVPCCFSVFSSRASQREWSLSK